MMKNGKYSLVIFISAILLIHFTHGWCGIKGKIAGRISDAENDEFLIGVNVYLEGTALGATTDEEGDYYIINIPPGTYTVVCSFIGYTPVEKRNVKVEIDHTTIINFQLKPEILEGEEVIIVAEREPVVSKDISNSRSVLNSEQIAEQLVSDFDDLLGKQTSFEFQLGSRDKLATYGPSQEYGYQEGTRIRGGSISETKIMMDGFDIQEELTSSGYTNFNLSSIQSIELITGGFNAEYGNARSGIVNVITKDGKDKYQFGVKFRGRIPGQKYFGQPIYDPEYNMEWRVYGAPQSLTEHPLPESGFNPGFHGWEEWRKTKDPLNYADIGKPDPSSRRRNNLLTAEQWQQLWKYRYRIREEIMKPENFWDQNWDFNISGPIWPGFNKITFYSSYKHEKIWAPFANSISNNYSDNYGLKLSFAITDNIKLRLNGSLDERVGTALYKNSGIQSYSVASSAWSSRYLVDNESGDTDFYFNTNISQQTTKILGFSWNHVLSSDFFYEFKLHIMDKKWDNHPPPARQSLFDDNGNIIEDNIAFRIDVTDQIDPQYYDPETAHNLIQTDDGRFFYVYDEAPVGYSAEDISDEFGNGIGGGDQEIFDSYSRKTVAKLDFSYQLDKYNFIKFGTEYSQIDMSQFESQWKPGRNRRWFFARKPHRFAVYFQDKVEFEGMIMNAGLRFDWRNSTGVAYDVEPFSDYLKQDEVAKEIGWSYPDDIGRPKDLGDPLPKVPSRRTVPKFAISPRLGVAHPISESTKLFFNYGYFYQEPTSEELYIFHTRSAGLIWLMGNPNLDYEKTISYELGFDQNIFEQYLFHIAGFYRDQSNLVKAYKVVNLDETLEYRTYNNEGYGETVGFEARLEKRFGKFLTGYLSYEYYGNSFGEKGNAKIVEGEDKGLVGETVKSTSQRFREKPRPSFRANINFHTPSKWGVEWGSFYPLELWTVNLQYTWQAGRWFTWNGFSTQEEFGSDDYVESNMQWRDHMVTNLRLSKAFEIGGVKISAYMQVNNLFNRKEMYPDEDLWDTNDAFEKYMDSLHLPQRTGERHGNDQPGDYGKDYIILPNFSQLIFLNPREIYLGIEINI